MQSENQTTHVMNRQGSEFAKLAREYGVSREHLAQFLKDEKRTTRFFRSLDPITWFQDLTIEAEKVGARLHLIPRLVVDYRLSYEQVVRNATATEEQWANDALSAILNDYINGIDGDGVINMGHNYSYPKIRSMVKETIVLVNWKVNQIDPREQIINWGLENGLQKTLPHVPFSMAEHEVNVDLDCLGKFRILETTGFKINEISYQFCEIRSGGLASMNRYYKQTEDTWFAFRR